MPIEITDRMREALKLLKRGHSPQQAADLAGVKRQSIYASSAYKAWRKASKEKVRA